jgi:hypothetical protein
LELREDPKPEQSHCGRASLHDLQAFPKFHKIFKKLVKETLKRGQKQRALWVNSKHINETKKAKVVIHIFK